MNAHEGLPTMFGLRIFSALSLWMRFDGILSHGNSAVIATTVAASGA
jgi:hypothetical protein